MISGDLVEVEVKMKKILGKHDISGYKFQSKHLEMKKVVYYFW